METAVIKAISKRLKYTTPLLMPNKIAKRLTCPGQRSAQFIFTLAARAWEWAAAQLCSGP